MSRISVGFAAGGGGKDDKAGSGAGTGGGISITPVAFISICDGKVHVHPVSPHDPIMSKILAMAPEAVQKISQLFSRKKEDDGEEK